jgi:dienelactone hydrolase
VHKSGDGERGAGVSGGDVRPLWFGPEARSLFGVLHVPGTPTGAGVVLCPSIGLDGEASQFAFRVLAARLAAEGCTVLRFDYDGTGDSVGGQHDPGRVAAWEASIGEAVALLRASGCTAVHLVGARLGAALAARAASADGEVSSLTCWYPTWSGSQFLRYQRALRRLYGMDGSRAIGDGATEIPGYVLDAATTADLAELAAWSPEVATPRALLVVDAGDPGAPPPRDDPPPAVFARHEATGADALFGVELMKAEVDPGDVEAIVAFITSLPGPPAPGPAVPVGRASAVVGVTDAGPIVERPVALGPAGLFGMVTEPPSPPGAATVGSPRYRDVLFLNAGSLHHIGPGRQWVEMGRTWAAYGVRSLRFDIGGVGESPRTGPPGVLSSYPPSAVADIDVAMAFLAPDHRDDVLLVGLCSGAYHCALAAPQVGAGAIALVNPLRMPIPVGDGTTLVAHTFEDDGPPVPVVAGDGQEPDQDGRRRLLGDLRDRGALTPVTRRLPDRLWALVNRVRGAEDTSEVFRRVVDSGVDVVVVCGPDEWRSVGRGRQAALRRMAETGRFHLVMVPTLDHSFHVAEGRQTAVRYLERWELGEGTGDVGPVAVTI